MQAGGAMLVTADHGNAEQMINDKTGQAHTAHTLNPVPLVLVGTRSGARRSAIGPPGRCGTHFA